MDQELVQMGHVLMENKKLVEGAIKGLLKTLDPHTSYMPPEMYKEMQVETEGQFGGLGIEITVRDDQLIVVSPIEDTPAFRAGLKAGDRVVTGAAYQVRLASLSTSVPAEGHEH